MEVQSQNFNGQKAVQDWLGTYNYMQSLTSKINRHH